MSAQQIAALRERAKLTTPTKTTGKHGSSDITHMCICNRQLQDILCRTCGYLFVGRQRRQCVLHPNEIHLMDAAVCPKCRTNSLIEIKISDTPVKKQPDVIITELSHLRRRRSSEHEKCGASLKGSSTHDEDWEKDIGLSHPPTLSTATFSSSRPSKNMVSTGEDWESELGSSGPSMTSSVHRSTSPVHSTFQGNKTSFVKFASSTPTKSSPTSLASSHPSKTSSASCTDADWEKEICISKAANTPSTVSIPSNSCTPTKSDYAVTPESRKEKCKVTFAPQKTENETRLAGPVSTQDNVVQQNEHQGVTKPQSKFVDSEVQTEFVVQVMEEPTFLQPTAHPAPPQFKKATDSGYMYQPKRPIDGGKETSVLRAAIKRSIAQNWHMEMNKMNDLCIGDRRF